MLQPLSKAIVTDNSGAKVIGVIKNLGGATVKASSIGSIIVCSVKKAIPNSPIKKGTVVKAVIVRTRKEIQRADGSFIKFDDNAVVLINEDKTPKGTRVFGPIAKELREKGFMKIISLAQEVL